MAVASLDRTGAGQGVTASHISQPNTKPANHAGFFIFLRSS
nr:MAG TPA: hypothetical protein [Caudoviricetes sp.]